MPFVVITDETAELPLRQLELDQCKRCVRERARLDEVDDFRLCGRILCLETRACLRNHLRHQIGRDRAGIMKTLLEFVQTMIER
jgi:hypothetical protein